MLVSSSCISAGWVSSGLYARASSRQSFSSGQASEESVESVEVEEYDGFVESAGGEGVVGVVGDSGGVLLDEDGGRLCTGMVCGSVCLFQFWWVGRRRA